MYYHIYAMRTTLDLDDTLYRRLKAAAALNGESVRAVVTRAIEREIDGAHASGTAVREPSPRPHFGALRHYALRKGGPFTIEHEREGVAAARERGEL
jgi:hypothetical protein